MSPYCLLSGGKDSVCTAHVLQQQGRLQGCVFIDTGIACPDTRPFVERLCEEQKWDLHVFKAPKTFEELVMKYGFPRNLIGHSWAFGSLKERAMIQAKQELGNGAVFAAGARRHESARRARSIAKGFRHNGKLEIENTIVEWTTPEVWAYLRANNLPVSPAYLSVGRSGDCLCGSFSKKGEADVIKRAYPDVAARIRNLEEAVKDKFPYPHNRWGSDRSKGGFKALDGRMTLEAIVCGSDCALSEEGQ
jgi:3'-phosphoadenosine 5'-phosphosulfate sulfotransferase (PAPS reductase)/FAD synthetase